MKQLKKKAPDIVIPLIVRVNVLAFLSFFLFFFFLDHKHRHEKYSAIGTTTFIS